MPLQSGDRFGPYEIVSAIGSGGMGVVYRARDTRLGRIVAIKFASQLAGDDIDRRQLLREAQHTSALNHPNICTIYEIGEDGGRPFIVMEFVDGQPLSAMIPRGGLPIERVIRYGCQIADALAHAHAHGVIHRDLKPANVVISSEGRVKVLDFGLARRTWHQEAAYAETVPATQPGMLAGTIAYMPPEVLRGAPADVRSDIWALGVMLHEMVTGTAPFGGRTEFEVSSKILTGLPPDLPPHVPASCRTVVRRCLEKDPQERYQTVSELLVALRDISSGQVRSAQGAGLAASAPPRVLVTAAGLAVAALLLFVYFFNPRVATVASVAVVPFAVAGDTADAEYLSDGVSEGLIEKLARVPQSELKVIALNSVLRYKGRVVEADVVGRELHVGAVLMGRVVQQSGGMSVTAELVNAADRSRMWGRAFTTAIGDLPAVQAQIAEEVSAALRIPLNREQKRRLEKRGTDDPRAYALYLKGRYFWNKYNEDGWTKSIEYFKQAIDIDPTYALAWAGLADAYYQLSSLVLAPAEAIPQAKAAAARALAIDEDVAEAHASLAIIKAQYDWDAKGAEAEFRKALELNPNYATAHGWYGQHLFAQARFEAALGEFTKARDLDPLSMILAVTAVWPLPHLGHEDEAIEQIGKIVEMFPNVPDLVDWQHDVRGEASLRKGLNDRAVADLATGYKAKVLCGDDPKTTDALKQAYEASGLGGYWQKQLELAVPRFENARETARKRSVRRYVSPVRLAELHARLGHIEQAFALLQDGYANRDESLRWLKAESLSSGSPWQNLRDDARFTQLLKGMGLE